MRTRPACPCFTGTSSGVCGAWVSGSALALVTLSMCWPRSARTVRPCIFRIFFHVRISSRCGPRFFVVCGRVFLLVHVSH